MTREWEAAGRGLAFAMTLGTALLTESMNQVRRFATAA